MCCLDNPKKVVHKDQVLEHGNNQTSCKRKYVRMSKIILERRKELLDISQSTFPFQAYDAFLLHSSLITVESI